MFAYLGLGPEEMVLLVLVALVMMFGPLVAVALGMASMRKYYHVRPVEAGGR